MSEISSALDDATYQRLLDYSRGKHRWYQAKIITIERPKWAVELHPSVKVPFTDAQGVTSGEHAGVDNEGNIFPVQCIQAAILHNMRGTRMTMSTDGQDLFTRCEKIKGGLQYGEIGLTPYIEKMLNQRETLVGQATEESMREELNRADSVTLIKLPYIDPFDCDFTIDYHLAVKPSEVNQALDALEALKSGKTDDIKPSSEQQRLFFEYSVQEVREFTDYTLASGDKRSGVLYFVDSMQCCSLYGNFRGAPLGPSQYEKRNSRNGSLLDWNSLAEIATKPVDTSRHTFESFIVKTPSRALCVDFDLAVILNDDAHGTDRYSYDPKQTNVIIDMI